MYEYTIRPNVRQPDAAALFIKKWFPPYGYAYNCVVSRRTLRVRALAVRMRLRRLDSRHSMKGQQQSTPFIRDESDECRIFISLATARALPPRSTIPPGMLMRRRFLESSSCCGSPPPPPLLGDDTPLPPRACICSRSAFGSRPPPGMLALSSRSSRCWSAAFAPDDLKLTEEAATRPAKVKKETSNLKFQKGRMQNAGGAGVAGQQKRMMRVT